MASGGFNLTDFIGVKDDHSGLVDLDADMALTATAATTYAHVGLSANKNFGATITPTKKNLGVKISLDQDKYGSGLLKLINNFIVTDDSTATEYYQDGTAASSVASSATEHNLLAITYETLDPDDPTDVIVTCALGGFVEGSGTRTGKHEERIKPTIEFVSKAATATISIPAALFKSDIVTPGGAQSLTSGLEYVTLYLPAT
jgi:hypothetical protein